jgi:hypothetical protein
MSTAVNFHSGLPGMTSEKHSTSDVSSSPADNTNSTLNTTAQAVMMSHQAKVRDFFES